MCMRLKSFRAGPAGRHADRAVARLATIGFPPSDADREKAIEAVRRLAAADGVPDADILASRAVWKDTAHMMFNLQEFIFIP